MYRTELFLLYDGVEEYQHFVYFDTHDKKYYQTSRDYKIRTFKEKYWILLILFLLLARVSEAVFSAYYSLFGPTIGFLLDVVFAVFTVYIGRQIAVAVKFDKLIAFSLREMSHEIQISQDDLKKRASDIWSCYKKCRNMVFTCVFVSTTMSILTALVSNGLLFAFACGIWMSTWSEIWYMGIGERKKWLMENLGDDFFT